MFDLRSFACICGNKVLNVFPPLLIICSIVLGSGCATLDGPPNPDDPLERYNRAMFSFNETLDKAIVKPVAKGYNWIMPDFLNSGVTNFFSNVDDVVVFFNSLLQLKFQEAVSTSARIVWNTTIGLLGFIDVATRMDLPEHGT